MSRPVEVRAERHSFFADLPQIVQTKNLKAARVGEDGSIPRHEPMQAAHLSNGLDSGAQVKMIGIGKQNPDAKFFQHILRDTLDRSQRSDRHEHRGVDFSMRSYKFAGAGGAAGGFNLELKRHCGGFYKELQRSDGKDTTMPTSAIVSNLCNLTSNF